MLEKDNMTRYIKFMSYWMKTMIPFSTFTITKNDINSRSSGQSTAFYIRMKDKISTTKNSKKGIIMGIPIQFFEMRKT
jgi:hypothetical protein